MRPSFLMRRRDFSGVDGSLPLLWPGTAGDRAAGIRLQQDEELDPDPSKTHMYVCLGFSAPILFQTRQSPAVDTLHA